MKRDDIEEDEESHFHLVLEPGSRDTFVLSLDGKVISIVESEDKTEITKRSFPEIVESIRKLRAQTKRGDMSIKDLIEEGRRF